MENKMEQLVWRGFAASVPGAGHIRYGIPCQDASAVFTAPRPAAIVCDGRGSAPLSHFGAQGAVEGFHFQLAVLEPMLAGILDVEEAKPEQWAKFCRILYRTLMQVKYNLVEKHHAEDQKEFDFTVAIAIAGKHHIGCFQVGDGAIVLRQNNNSQIAFQPEKGEFANQTHFLRPNGEVTLKFQSALFPMADNSGIAITSDGPEHLMFHLATMTPGPVFGMMFDDLAKGELVKQDLMDYLTRAEWIHDPRGADDRSIVVLNRGLEQPDYEHDEPDDEKQPAAHPQDDEPEIAEPKANEQEVVPETEHQPEAFSETPVIPIGWKLLPAIELVLIAVLCIIATCQYREIQSLKANQLHIAVTPPADVPNSKVESPAADNMQEAPAKSNETPVQPVIPQSEVQPSIEESADAVLVEQQTVLTNKEE